MVSIYTTRLDTSRKEIRLLELLPANNPQEPIQCRLYTTQLSMETEYTALSYVWGDPTATSPITVNSLPFQATHNLCAALRRIRSKSNLPTTLWVDAICINQSDNDEKSSQVQLMRDVYHNASLVTVWLGESNEYTDEAMVIIKLTAYLVKRTRAKGEKRYSVAYAMTVIISALFRSDSRLTALLEFFGEYWWSRVWVVQEVVVSRCAKVMCGTTEILWEDLQIAFDLWTVLHSNPDGYDYPDVGKSELRYLVEMTEAAQFFYFIRRRNLQDHQVVQDGVVGSSSGLRVLNDLEGELEATFVSGRSFESTDPRDKVYAWLGLFEREGFAIVPDYNASTAEVYVNALKTVMELTGSLLLVALTAGLDHSEGAIPGLPSWAPDLRHNKHRECSWGAFLSYRASASEKARAAVSPDSRVLRADTLVIDNIQLTDADKDEWKDWELGGKLCRWMYLVLQHPSRLHASAAMGWDAGDLLSKEFFAAVVCPAILNSSQDDGDIITHGMRSKDWPFIEKWWAGFMMFCGHLDCLQNFAQWRKEHQPHYYDQLQPDYRSTCPVFMAIERPATLDSCHLLSANHQLPPDEENLNRFCSLWGLPEDEKPIYFEYEAERGDRLGRNEQPTTNDEYVLFLERAREYTAHKTLFITNLGLLGSGSRKIRPGDSLAIIRGCGMPVVIRKHSSGDGSFEIVGKCYVRKLMDGRFLENLRDEGKLKWESLSFR